VLKVEAKKGVAPGEIFIPSILHQNNIKDVFMAFQDLSRSYLSQAQVYKGINSF
jgi:hypothetical protein